MGKNIQERLGDYPTSYLCRTKLSPADEKRMALTKCHTTPPPSDLGGYQRRSPIPTGRYIAHLDKPTYTSVCNTRPSLTILYANVNLARSVSFGCGYANWLQGRSSAAVIASGPGFVYQMRSRGARRTRTHARVHEVRRAVVNILKLC